jgi:plastocyanin
MLIGLGRYYNTMKSMTASIIELCFVVVIVTTIPIPYAYSQTNSQTSKSNTISIMRCPMNGSCFFPCQITVAKGDTVTWVNRDTINHMIISGSGQRGPDGWFSSPVIFSHGMFSHVFDRKGAFTYYDSTNTYAQGVVIVDSSLYSNFVKLQQSYFSDWWCTR